MAKARKSAAVTAPAVTATISKGKEEVPDSFQVKDKKTGEMLTCPRISAGAMTGNTNFAWLERLLRQYITSVPSDVEEHGSDRLAVEATAALGGIAPRNTTEGMLATQMLATHNVALEQLRRAQLLDQPLEAAQFRMNSALRLMRLFIDQMQTLARLQGSLIQQKVEMA